MLKKTFNTVFCLLFTLQTTLIGIPEVRADNIFNLPAPGSMVNLSPAYQPVIIKGLTVHKDNPFLFDFIVDVGQEKMSGEPLKKEGEKLIKYFLASLAIPDKDVWVNLSPYEKNKMIPEVLGQTDMGRDLLEQDYILKQITASLIYPEKQLGKIFWERVYSKIQDIYGTTHVPINTFNKVWIMADRAQVFERGQTAFVVDSHLKVMLEEDYLALKKHSSVLLAASHKDTHSIGANIVREIILPELEKEVNTGKNFANLRQIFNSIILSSWYKKDLEQALLNQVYSDKSKINGVLANDAAHDRALIYQKYLEAYKKGVFNYIKDDIASNGLVLPRKYFSGGIDKGKAADPAMTSDAAALSILAAGTFVDMKTGLILVNQKQDAAIEGLNAKALQEWNKLTAGAQEFVRSFEGFKGYQNAIRYAAFISWAKDKKLNWGDYKSVLMTMDITNAAMVHGKSVRFPNGKVVYFDDRDQKERFLSMINIIIRNLNEPVYVYPNKLNLKVKFSFKPINVLLIRAGKVSMYDELKKKTLYVSQFWDQEDWDAIYSQLKEALEAHHWNLNIANSAAKFSSFGNFIGGFTQDPNRWVFDAYVNDPKKLKEFRDVLLAELGRIKEEIMSIRSKRTVKIHIEGDSTDIKKFPLRANLKGGIDLNTSDMRWKINKDGGKGVEMDLDQAMMERIKGNGIDGLSPVILKITPVLSIWPIVGLQS